MIKEEQKILETVESYLRENLNKTKKRLKDFKDNHTVEEYKNFIQQQNDLHKKDLIDDGRVEVFENGVYIPWPENYFKNVETKEKQNDFLYNLFLTFNRFDETECS